MKVCLYLEGFHFMGGIMFKGIGTGLITSYKNQREVLKHLVIPFVEAWDDSCDLLQINTPWAYSLYIMHKAKKRGTKIAVWAHVTAEDSVNVFRFTKILFPLSKRYLTYAYGRADLIFCPSEHTRKLLLAYGLPDSKLKVMSNGVNVEKFYADEVLRENGRKELEVKGLVIGTVGLAVPRKGIDSFLKLARKHPEHQFVWIGKIYNAFLAKPLPRDLPANVKFTGYVDDVVAAMNALDIFVFLSSEENQGMVIMEAGSVGLPMVLRELPAYKGWMRDGENCLMATTQDGLEKHLDALINDPALRTRLGKAARKMAESESIDEIGKKVKASYDALLEGA